MSEKRKKLLILLLNGPLIWDDIKKLLDVTASGMLPQIKILENEGLIIKEGRQYHLTDSGELIAFHLEKFERTLMVIDQQNKYWQEHNIKALPQEFFFRLGELNTIQINESRMEEILEPHAPSLDVILKSKKVFGMSPIIHPIYIKIFLLFAQEGRDVRFILSKNAYEKTKKEYYNFLLECEKYKNVHLSIYNNDMRFAYLVTEKILSLILFTKTGLFDSKQDLVSSDLMALKWGEDIFSYYYERSSPVNEDGHY